VGYAQFYETALGRMQVVVHPRASSTG
jgi:hypothetical protein